MTGRYEGDCCPACGSYQVLPYAVILGGREEYGYHCEDMPDHLARPHP